MKKIITFLFVLCALTMSCTLVYATDKPEIVEAEYGSVSLDINDESNEYPALVFEDILYVPLHDIVEALGKSIYIDEAIHTIKVINRPASQNQVEGWTEAIIFDDLEISLGNDIEFTILKNQYSEYNDATVIKIPIRIKNLKSETHGLSTVFCDFYNPKGTKAEDLCGYFDDSLDSAGRLRSGAEMETYIYIEYCGDGDYVVEFDDWLTTEEIIFAVYK